MASRIQELADLIRPHVEQDELKMFSTADFERGLTDDVRRTEPRFGQQPQMPTFLSGLAQLVEEQHNPELKARFDEIIRGGPARRPSREQIAEFDSMVRAIGNRQLISAWREFVRVIQNQPMIPPPLQPGQFPQQQR